MTLLRRLRFYRPVRWAAYSAAAVLMVPATLLEIWQAARLLACVNWVALVREIRECERSHREKAPVRSQVQEDQSW